MTQEEKQLLLKDLCARLPYGAEVSLADGISGMVTSISTVPHGTFVTVYFNRDDVKDISLEEIKPYLRPIKSMTLEECDKLFKILDIREDSGEWLKINDIGVLRLFTENGKDFYEIAEAMDYLYSIHVDFRDLIPVGLALEAPEGMYKTE